MTWSAVHTPRFAAPLRALDSLRVEPGESGFTVIARLWINPQDPNLRGHFPGMPIYPGVFIVETLCQAMTEALRPHGHSPQLREVSSLRLSAPLHGNEELTLTINVAAKPEGWAVRAIGRRRDGISAATVQATFDEGGVE